MLSTNTKDDNTLWKQFSSHYLFQNLNSSQLSKQVYLSFDVFWTILDDILYQELKNENSSVPDTQAPSRQQIQALADNDSLGVISILLKGYQRSRDSKQGWDSFKLSVEDWFHQSMENASAQFKSRIFSQLIFIGFMVSIVFNLDLIVLFSNVLAWEGKSSPYLLGLGWSSFVYYEVTPYDLILKFFGWLLSALVLAFAARSQYEFVNGVKSIIWRLSSSKTPTRGSSSLITAANDLINTSFESGDTEGREPLSNQERMKLRRTMVSLYDDMDSIELVLDELQFDASDVKLHGTTKVAWNSIIQQAIKRDRLINLVSYALEEYPNNQELTSIVQLLKTK
ncbi:MAG: hypothetical protein HRU41_04375 [Saprospiraceae bacterium]|nr:hypothetical protein [Saprospiraceae bacterium]